MVTITVGLLAIAGSLYYLIGRRMRDARLDRDWSGEAGRYDAPAGVELYENVRRDGAENARAYMRMLDVDRPPRY